MLWNRNALSGSKRASGQQLQQGFDQSSKKQCFWPCPKCNRSFASRLLDDHINQCIQPSYSGILHVESRNESAGSVSPARPIAIDVLSVLQAIADENPSASEIFNGDDTTDFKDAVNSHDRQCASSRQARSDSDSCNAPFHLNCDVQFQEYIICKQADMSLCADRPCESGNTTEASVDDPKPLDYHSSEKEILPNSGESERRGPDMRKLGCQEITEGSLETDSAVLTCTVKFMDTPVQQRALDENAKEANRRVVDRPPAGFKLYERQKQSQAKVSMFFKQPSQAGAEHRRSVTVLEPGMILFKNWLGLEKQQRLVQESQNVADLFHRPITSGGGKYHVYSMCWGPKWNPKSHRYAGSGAKRPLPDWMFDLAQEISREAQQHTHVYPSDLGFSPDVALANFYPVKDEELGVIGLGGHQDLDDSCTMPVVSVSVGDSMTFFYRRLPPLSRRKSMIYVSVDEKAAKSCEDGDVAHNREQQVILRSGDVLVFGGKSRLIYHGTRHVQAGTRPPGLHMVPGRLNFTFRQTDENINAQKCSSGS